MHTGNKGILPWLDCSFCAIVPNLSDRPHAHPNADVYPRMQACIHNPRSPRMR